jgi:hypothetical protein
MLSIGNVAPSFSELDGVNTDAAHQDDNQATGQ